jgi:hypothetical protein
MLFLLTPTSLSLGLAAVSIILSVIVIQLKRKNSKIAGVMNELQELVSDISVSVKDSEVTPDEVLSITKEINDLADEIINFTGKKKE